MIEWILLIVLAILILFIAAAFIGRHAKLRSVFTTTAASLCDPDSWRVRFYLRTFVVKGRIDGYPMGFTASGDVKGSALAHAYLLLDHPIKENFRFYYGSDPSFVAPGIRPQIEAIQQTPGFYALILTSDKTPLLAKLLSRPIGLGYKPGVLLCTIEKASFDPDLLRQRFSLLIDLAQHGEGRPLR
jgi:hypothetical protein